MVGHINMSPDRVKLGRHQESDLWHPGVIDPWTTRRGHHDPTTAPPRSQRYQGHRPTHTLTFARPWEHNDSGKHTRRVNSTVGQKGGKVHISRFKAETKKQ